MTTTIKYLINANKVTFYKDKEIRTIGIEAPGLFHSLVSNLKQGRVDVPTTVKEATLDLLANSNEYLPGVRARLAALEEAGMPTAPFFNFIKSCTEEFLMRHSELLGMVGTVDAPLTWEGDLVLYQRAAWSGGANVWAAKQDFKPGTVLEGDFKVSPFDWTMNACPDTGLAFEVVVKAKDIISCQKSGLWNVRKLTQLSTLGTHVKQSSKAETPIVEFLTNCLSAGENAVVRLPYNAGTAAKLVNSLFTESVSPASVSLINPVRVMVGSC